MSASTVAAVIGVLADEPWMPRISHWEIATTDGVWGVHAELDCKTSGPAFRELLALGDRVGSAVTEVSDSLRAVDFVHDDVPVRVWWLRPTLRWIVPKTCATCPTKLSCEPGARFVRLGEGDREAPVICVPCRDRMQAEFIAAAREDVPARRAEADRLQAQIDEMVHAAMGTRKVRLFDEVGEVRNARTIADAQLARANTLDQLCREKNEQLAAAEQLRLTPLERLTLRFALELVDDAIANDPTEITEADRAAMDRLRALSTGPVVAYRNPWRPGVLLCVEHGEGWEGMKPLSVEDLPNGGTCTAGDPANPDDVCGRDVLAGDPR